MAKPAPKWFLPSGSRHWGVDARPRLEIGHLDETNRSGHRMRQGVLTQFSAPQMDTDFEKLHHCRRYRGWLRPKASGCKRIRGLLAWVNTHAGSTTFAD